VEGPAHYDWDAEVACLELEILEEEVSCSVPQLSHPAPGRGTSSLQEGIATEARDSCAGSVPQIPQAPAGRGACAPPSVFSEVSSIAGSGDPVPDEILVGGHSYSPRMVFLDDAPVAAGLPRCRCRLCVLTPEFSLASVSDARPAMGSLVAQSSSCAACVVGQCPNNIALAELGEADSEFNSACATLGPPFTHSTMVIDKLGIHLAPKTPGEEGPDANGPAAVVFPLSCIEAWRRTIDPSRVCSSPVPAQGVGADVALFRRSRCPYPDMLHIHLVSGSVDPASAVPLATADQVFILRRFLLVLSFPSALECEQAEMSLKSLCPLSPCRFVGRHSSRSDALELGRVLTGTETPVSLALSDLGEPFWHVHAARLLVAAARGVGAVLEDLTAGSSGTESLPGRHSCRPTASGLSSCSSSSSVV